jgi:hypothetical protein
MPKTKISEFDVNPDNNTDINSINIAEGCAPSGINNAIRQLMSDLKDLQAGTSGDTIPLTAGGTGATSASTARTALGLAIGTNVQAYDAELAAIAGIAANGLVTRTSSSTAEARTITGTTNVITVTNGDGVSGNPTLTTGSLVARTDTAQSFSAAQRGAITALTDGATITPDFAVANNYSVTLGGNRTLANPSNLTAGQSGSIFLTQDGTGSRVLSWGSYWDFAGGGTAPTLSTAASAVDRVDYIVRSSTSIHAVFTGNYS